MKHSIPYFLSTIDGAFRLVSDMLNDDDVISVEFHKDKSSIICAVLFNITIGGKRYQHSLSQSAPTCSLAVAETYYEWIKFYEQISEYEQPILRRFDEGKTNSREV